MKKIMFTKVLLLALIILTACNGNADTQEIVSTTATQIDNNSIDAVGEETVTENLSTEALKIQIDVATDEILNAFTNLYHANLATPDNSDGVTLVIWANQPLFNFSVVALAADWLEDSDEWGFMPTFEFGSVSDFLPGEAFVIENYKGLGTLPHRGVSFTDENGENTRVFFFSENQAYPEVGEGPWIIHEIEPERLIWGFSYDVPFPSDLPISAVERDADINAVTHFNANIVSKTFIGTGFGLHGNFGGYILVFELENISESAIAVDIVAVFHTEYGTGGSLIDQDIHFESGQTRQFNHTFGEYVFADALSLIIEYWIR